MEQLKKRAEELNSQVAAAMDKLGVPGRNDELEKIRAEMALPDFWQDSGKAQETSKREAELARRIQPWQDLKKSVEEVLALASLNDPGMEHELNGQVTGLEDKLEDLKKELKFNGPYDDHDIILSIHAGAGGTDAQDWAQMLLRMYVRWAESHSLKTNTVEQTSGEEAGIKSATIGISGGSFLYGKLAGEHGVHRLVRLSPFNADHLRQTSFAKVEVLPAISRPDEVQLDEKDLKIDVFRAGGHGGQSVNTTDSAVRVTHLPTGISVAIQNERSQLQNKETAMAILRSRLIALQMEQHVQNLSEIKGPNQSAEWGSQIRSYVLHPYKQVKDLRSGFETSEVEKVLDGSLDPLIEAWLEHSIQSER